MSRPTLEEQLYWAKVIDKRNYVKKILKAMSGERTSELYKELGNAPEFVVRDAQRLFAEISIDEINKHPTPKKYIRKSKNLSAFMYLFIKGLVEIQEHRYLGIFKKGVVVCKEKT